MLRNKLLWVIVISVVVRLIFATVYHYNGYPDTYDYFQVAKEIHNKFSDDKMEVGNILWPRPPLFPLLINLAGFQAKRIVFYQAVMGVGIAVFLYLIFSRLTGSSMAGMLAGFCYALNPSQMLFEFALISETTGTFLFIGAVFLFFIVLTENSKPKISILIALGFLVSLSTACRSQFKIIIALMAVFLAWRLYRQARPELLKIIAYIAPIALIFALLSSNAVSLDGTQPVVGLSMMENLIVYAEQAPDEFKDYREIIIKNREEYLAVDGSAVVHSIALAIPELREKAGGDFTVLSNDCIRMAFAIIRKIPIEYSKIVISNIVDFWKPTWYSRQFGLRAVLAGERKLSKTVAVCHAIVHLAFMLVFLAIPVLYILCPGFRKNAPVRLEILFIYAAVFSANILDSIFSFGEPRHKTSFEPLIFGAVIWLAFAQYRRWKTIESKEGAGKSAEGELDE
ncbi:MAG: hypothetical protein V1794_16040 [Candidatus Glassbacteria bacterium]